MGFCKIEFKHFRSMNTMSWSVYSPMFPSLTPRPADPLWFSVDRPVDDEADLAKEEAEHAKALQKISGQGSDLTPIGKTNDQLEENEDEEDEDEDSESDHEDEDEEDV